MKISLCALAAILATSAPTFAAVYTFSSTAGNGTPVLTTTESGVTLTATSSALSDMNISSGFLAPSQIGAGATWSMTFSSPIAITSFQIGEFTNISDGANYVFTPSSGTAVTIADNSSALAGAVATLNPTDWTSVTGVTLSYTGSSNWRVGMDNINFTPVPESSTVSALGVFALTLAAWRRRS
ncbi:hypothetical protein [Luteolibacter sp. AS25]|uniref:hypothetical protein n=1 Tax=Luteolibacter sp. AS25 TaxID=3135776 RepID=UPI00398B0D70